LKDINDNRSGVRFDELGMVVKTFAMGKDGENKGDLMDMEAVESSEADKPGSEFNYDLSQYTTATKPNYANSIVYETHYFDSIETGATVMSQQAYIYYCGGGNEVMRKVQAEPGIALQENEDGSISEIIRTNYPDGTFAKVEFDAWKQLSFDRNDTVLESQWYTDRINDLLDAIFIADKKDPVKEKEAAQKAAAHANTPATIYLDSLGRNFLSIADNADKGKYKTVSETDIEGNLKKITDARGNAVMQYKYDMLGNQLYSLSMDAGERWMINDIMGKPMKTWDSRDHIFRYEYDRLHRPERSYVTTAGTEINFTWIIYGDVYGYDEETNTASNQRGKISMQYDTAGIIANTGYDFKGNLLQSFREICKEYSTDIDWNNNHDMEPGAFTASTVYDALNRAIKSTAPDGSIITPTYNEASLLKSLSVQLKGAADSTVFVKNISYNEKGQRESIIYGNDTKTNYSYDTNTFRLMHLTTNRKDETDALQKLSYTYDAVGNITFIKDEAQQTFFYNNAIVEPSCDYVYDAIYQLIQATGREHIAQNQLPQDNWRDENFKNLVLQGDDSAMRN
jgi:YD repeat-containing protein